MGNIFTSKKKKQIREIEEINKKLKLEIKKLEKELIIPSALMEEEGELQIEGYIEPEPENCCICMDDIEEGKVETLKCDHTFCKSCIKEWLKTHNTCPLCRTKIKVKDDWRDHSNQLSHRQRNDLLYIEEEREWEQLQEMEQRNRRYREQQEQERRQDEQQRLRNERDRRNGRFDNNAFRNNVYQQNEYQYAASGLSSGRRARGRRNV